MLVITNKVSKYFSIMNVVKTTTVKIDLGATLSSMSVGECWSVPESVSVAYLRVFCSNYGKAVNKSFTVNAQETATVTRTR